MAGGFRRTRRSGLDLEEIFAWVAEDRGLHVAIAQMERLEAGLVRIEAFHRIGRARPDLGENTFTLPVRPWVIIYASWTRTLWCYVSSTAGVTCPPYLKSFADPCACRA